MVLEAHVVAHGVGGLGCSGRWLPNRAEVVSDCWWLTILLAEFWQSAVFRTFLEKLSSNANDLKMAPEEGLELTSPKFPNELK